METSSLLSAYLDAIGIVLEQDQQNGPSPEDTVDRKFLVKGVEYRLTFNLRSWKG